MRSKLLAALLVFVFPATTCSNNARYLERSVTVGANHYRYRVWLPQRYTKLHHWPVVLYLHGSGERGDDDVRQLSNGIAPALEKYASRYRCIVVLPQCRFGEEWIGEEETQALAALDATIREFHGDRRRVYLTGVSMGGAGTWYMARHRHRFAAVVPVCGEVARRRDDPFPSDPPPDIARIVGAPDPYATLAQEIGDTPVWAWHGAKDDVIPVTESRRMFAALEAAKGNARYTEVENSGHEVWNVAYANADLVKWLLKQRR